jgi:YbbR domain-containing protein
MKIKVNLKKNIGIKIASFIFAFFLWFLVSSSERITTTVYAPIDIDHLKKGYIALTNEQAINLVLEGSSLVLKGIESKNVKVEIDVSSFKPGKNTYVMKERDINVPPGAEILNYQPKEVTVFIDKIVEKEFKVIPSTTGKIKSGLYLKNINISPEIVNVSGALSVINNLSYVETISINLSDVLEDTELDVPIKLVEGIDKVDPKSVDVLIDVEEEIIEKEYKNISVKIINKTPYKIKSFIPNNVRVRLRGRTDILMDNDFKTLAEVYVELSDINNTGTYIRNISYKKLNDKVEIVYIVPEVIRVEVEE